MKRLLLLLVLAATALLLGRGDAAAQSPDPLACTGYPEPRIYLENQSWWEPA